MKKLFASIALISSLALGACATTAPISSSPGPVITNSTLVADLQGAAFNLDSAVAVGALAPDDPAPACLHRVLQRAGIEVPAGAAAPKSFTPKADGLVSDATIAYIKGQQAKRRAGAGASVSADCKALLGQLVIDGLGAAAKLVPGLLVGF